MISKKYIRWLYSDFLDFKVRLIYKNSVYCLLFPEGDLSPLSTEPLEYRKLLLKYMVK